MATRSCDRCDAAAVRRMGMGRAIVGTLEGEARALNCRVHLLVTTSEAGFFRPLIRRLHPQRCSGRHTPKRSFRPALLRERDGDGQASIAAAQRSHLRGLLISLLCHDRVCTSAPFSLAHAHPLDCDRRALARRARSRRHPDPRLGSTLLSAGAHCAAHCGRAGMVDHILDGRVLSRAVHRRTGFSACRRSHRSIRRPSRDAGRLPPRCARFGRPGSRGAPGGLHRGLDPVGTAIASSLYDPLFRRWGASSVPSKATITALTLAGGFASTASWPATHF